MGRLKQSCGGADHGERGSGTCAQSPLRPTPKQRGALRTQPQLDKAHVQPVVHAAGVEVFVVLPNRRIFQFLLRGTPQGIEQHRAVATAPHKGTSSLGTVQTSQQIWKVPLRPHSFLLVFVHMSPHKVSDVPEDVKKGPPVVNKQGRAGCRYCQSVQVCRGVCFTKIIMQSAGSQGTSAGTQCARLTKQTPSQYEQMLQRTTHEIRVVIATIARGEVSWPPADVLSSGFPMSNR